MKKFLAFLLAAMLLLSVGAVAVAEEETVKEASIGKVVTITGDGAKMPAETFGFSITKKSVTDAAEGVTLDNMLTPTITSVTFDEGDVGTEKTISITYPSYTSVGIYRYMVKETAGDTAGMTYASNEYTLVVYVVNDDVNGGVKVAGSKLADVTNKKHDKFENKYEAGSLAVKKVVAGELGEKGKSFNFTVTFTQPEGKVAKSTISYVVGTETKTLTFTDGTATASISLKDGQTITFKNVPYTVSYTVTEDDATEDETGIIKNGDYVVTYSNCSGTISAATATATVTNTKGGTIDTGITTDSLPYVMLLGFVILAGAALIIKRRVAHN